MADHGRPLGYTVAGMRGYAAAITDRFLRFADADHDLHRLIAVCDPARATMAERAFQLQRAGIAVHDSLGDLLALPEVDVIWLPVPIALHRPFTEQALAAGKHVVVEKPAAGSLADVDAMIRARDASGKKCFVAFQDVYQQPVADLKAKLIAGQFGAARQVSIIGCWPRGLKYFNRNNWAGKKSVEGVAVLDSPINNAMAHFIHLALFLLGAEQFTSAPPKAVAAELYRANAIENFDTCSIMAQLENGVPLQIAMTHACSKTVNPTITITTDRTVIRIEHQKNIRYELDGRQFDHPLESPPGWPVTRAVTRAIGGDADAPVGTLEMARAHTALVVAANAAPIVDVPSGSLRASAEGTTSIAGIEDALRATIDQRQLLSEVGRFDWTRPASGIMCAI